MNIIIMLVVGGFLGRIASIIMRSKMRWMALNLLFGIIGALIGGMYFAPEFLGAEKGITGDMSPHSLGLSLLCSAVLLLFVNLPQRREPKKQEM